MSYFKAKMHQILFRLGLRPDPAGERTALPQPLAGFKGPTSKGREGERTRGSGVEKEGENDVIGGRLRHGFWGG